MALAPHPIHLFCCSYLKVDDPGLLSSYRALLTEQERATEMRFHFARDQRCYLVTRALVRTILSRYVDIAPQNWMFTANRYGRPEIANHHPDVRGLSFNLSHTNGLVVLAVTREAKLGVDTESLQARQPALDIADRCFAPREVLSLRALPEARRDQRFFEYWTLKESYIKARGMGLSLALDSFGFSFPCDSVIELTVDGDDADTNSPWHFWQLLLAPHYMTALCAAHSHSLLPQPIARNIVPLASECALDYELLRTSTKALPALANNYGFIAHSVKSPASPPHGR
jgi:4'-phosphopantetheinyl transferase